jgi:hypothetical protein
MGGNEEVAHQEVNSEPAAGVDGDSCVANWTPSVGINRGLFALLDATLAKTTACKAKQLPIPLEG